MAMIRCPDRFEGGVWGVVITGWRVSGGENRADEPDGRGFVSLHFNSGESPGKLGSRRRGWTFDTDRSNDLASILASRAASEIVQH